MRSVLATAIATACLIAVAGAAVILTTSIAQAQAASVVAAAPRDRALALSGDYSLQSDAQVRLRESVERAVEPLNFVVRSVARRRLLTVNQPSARVEIFVRGDSVIIRYANQPELRAQRRGASRPWKNTAGESLSVAVQAPAAAEDAEPLLYERYIAEDGTRENRWFLDAATGQARLEVTITSPRLPSPMRLELNYTRVAPR